MRGLLGNQRIGVIKGMRGQEAEGGGMGVIRMQAQMLLIQSNTDTCAVNPTVRPNVVIRNPRINTQPTRSARSILRLVNFSWRPNPLLVQF